MSKTLPIITEKEVKPEPLAIAIYTVVMGWRNKTFVDLETGKKVPSKLWEFIGLVPLNGAYRNGRKVLEHRITKAKTETGIIVERSKTYVVGKVYGFEAVAQALSGRFPITTEKTKRLIDNAMRNQMNHVKFVLKSDLVPTSIDRYVGKNEWTIVANYPSRNKIYEKINKALKDSGSSLRVRAGLKYKLIE